MIFCICVVFVVIAPFLFLILFIRSSLFILSVFGYQVYQFLLSFKKSDLGFIDLIVFYFCFIYSALFLSDLYYFLLSADF